MEASINLDDPGIVGDPPNEWHLELVSQDVDEDFVAYRAWPLRHLVGESYLP